MDPELFLNKYIRYKNLKASHKEFINKVYLKFKQNNEYNNKQLLNYILMFTLATVFYKGKEYEFDVDKITDEKIQTIIKCCSKTLPASRTFYGIQLCQMYNMPRQQNNLNVKKPKGENECFTDGYSNGKTGTIDFDDEES